MSGIIEFLENEYHVPDSEKRIRFEGGWEWQKNILRKLFERKDEDGKRLYTAGVISTPRQQGKSLILQCVGLYMLIAGGRNLNVVSVACDTEQASLVPERAKKAVSLNPRLARSIEIRRNNLYCPANGNRWLLMSSDQPSATGKIIDILLFDEMGMMPEHQWPLVYLLTPSLSARREPLMLIASTVGEYEEGPLHDLMEIAREEKDEHTYLYYTNEIKSPLTNQAQLDRDKLLMPEPVFMRHYCNLIIQGGSFLSDEDIEAIIIPEEGSPGDDNLRCIGCDWGLTKDKCAAVSIAKTDDEQYVWDRARVFRGSKKNPVDLNGATDAVREMYRSGVTRKVIFDKWQAVSTIQTLQSEWGSDVVEGYDFTKTSRKRLFQNFFTLVRNRQVKLYSERLKQCWKRSCQTCPENLRCSDVEKHEFLREVQGLQCDSDFNVTHGKRGDDITVAVSLALLAAVQEKKPVQYEPYATSRHFSAEDLGIR